MGGQVDRKSDLISVVEAAYDLASDERTWLAQLLRTAAPRFSRGFGVTIQTYHPGMPITDSVVDAWQIDRRTWRAMQGLAGAHPDLFQRINSPAGRERLVTAGGKLGLSPSEANSLGPFVEYLHPVGVRDFVGMLALDPSGHAIWLGAPTASTRPPTRRECATWSRIAVHISAGARLRRAGAPPPGADISTGSDAVLSASGALVHAEPQAQSRSAREALRRAVLAIDRARSKSRRREDEALDLWRGLVAGRWSLVESFDHDGRRYLVAHKNEPHIKDPRALVPRERQVLAYLAAGDSLKLTAYTLGLSTTSIFRHRQSAMRKLGLRDLAEVVSLFAGQRSSATERTVREKSR
jgi:DNA-binding CsgD family transcriptional regulator